MRECRKYWLMAVSSFVSTLLRCCTILRSPFIRRLSSWQGFAEGFYAPPASPAMTAGRSGGRGGRLALLACDHGADVRDALAALRPHAQGFIDLAHRAHPGI